MTDLEVILNELKLLENTKNREGMARFGINADNAFGVSMKVLRELAKPYKRQHELALQLWDTGFHECRILAGIIADPERIREETLDAWVDDFDSWDVCDQACINLIVKSPFAVSKIRGWAESEKEFTRRTAFSLIAVNTVHNKNLDIADYKFFLELIKKYSFDERNFVKKAVNWALRQIGKKSIPLNEMAVAVAEELLNSEFKAARWISKDALKELTNTKIQSMLSEKLKK